MASEPYATISGDGVRVHIPTETGEIAFTLNGDNARALVVAVAARVAELGTAKGKLNAALSLASWLLK